MSDEEYKMHTNHELDNIVLFFFNPSSKVADDQETKHLK